MPIENDDTDALRNAVRLLEHPSLAARLAGRVYVLHAFQKKSKSGIKTPQAEVELVETRLKAVLGRYRNERE
jgi:phage-related protein